MYTRAPEYRHRNSDAELKVVGSCRKCHSDALRIRESEPISGIQGCEEHEHEVKNQRGANAKHVERDGDDNSALEQEDDHDGEQKRNESQGTD